MTFTALALGFVLQTPVTPSTDLNEVTFQTAWSELSQNESLFLQMTGSTFYKGKTTPFVSNLSWYSGTVTSGGTSKILLQAEIEEIVNNVLIKRIVADGDTVYSYDLNTHEYSATAYGGYGTVRPPSYQTNLLSDLNLGATGPTAYMTKLLRQVYNTNQAYASWMPGVMSQNLPQTAVHDPVNPNVTYVSTPTDWYYMYNGSPKRSIVFEIVPVSQSEGAPPQDQLQSVTFNQLDQLGQTQRLTQWKMMPYTGVTFAPSLFKPYSGAQTAGWKAVVAPRPVSN